MGNPELFGRLEQLAKEPAAAVAELLKVLPADQHAARFQALLLQARIELGLPAVTQGAAEDIPEAKQAAYEEAIRRAARQVGQELLKANQPVAAWTYFRLIGEPQPVAEALEKLSPADDALSDLLQLALGEGVHPRLGFDWVLDKHGLCNAITTVGQTLYQPGPARQHAIRRLTTALHAELLDRLRADLEQRGMHAPASATLADLLRQDERLFEEDNYHIDLSHLSSVVQLALELAPGPEAELAEQLCQYGERLNPKFHPPADAPFAAGYAAYRRYFAVLNRHDLEANLAYFHAQADQAEGETGPAEVLVHLYAALHRPAEALGVYEKHLAEVDPRQLSCPSPVELCRRLEDYAPLRRLCQRREDLVGFVAALLAGPPGG